MDISLFERMINNGMNGSILKVQHRMRPAFANLIRPKIYKDLLDHDSVLAYPPMVGIDKNLLFLNHSNAESTVNAGGAAKCLTILKNRLYFCRLGFGRNVKEKYIRSSVSGGALQLFHFARIRTGRRDHFDNVQRSNVSVFTGKSYFSFLI